MFIDLTLAWENTCILYLYVFMEHIIQYKLCIHMYIFTSINSSDFWLLFYSVGFLFLLGRKGTWSGLAAFLVFHQRMLMCVFLFDRDCNSYLPYPEFHEHSTKAVKGWKLSLLYLPLCFGTFALKCYQINTI